jgi:hypothetical protein
MSGRVLGRGFATLGAGIGCRLLFAKEIEKFHDHFHQERA